MENCKEEKQETKEVTSVLLTKYILKNGEVTAIPIEEKTDDESSKKQKPETSLCADCDRLLHMNCSKVGGNFVKGFEKYPYITEGYQVVNEVTGEVVRFYVGKCDIFVPDVRLEDLRKKATNVAIRSRKQPYKDRIKGE